MSQMSLLNTRCSLHRVTTSVFAICLFCFSILLASAQSFQYEHIKSYYPQEDAFKIERVAYASPYYAVAGRTQGVPEIRMYLYENGAVQEAYRVYPQDQLFDLALNVTSSMMANEHLTAIFYRNSDGADNLVWFDQSQSEDAVLSSHSITNATSITDIQLEDQNIFYLGEKEGQVFGKIELNEQLQVASESISPFEYEGLVSTRFGIASGELLFLDNVGEEGAQVNGLVRASFNQEGSLEFQPQPFLPSLNRMIFLNIKTFDPYVMLWNRNDTEDPTSSDEIEFYMWNQGEEAELILAEPIDYTDRRADFNGEILVLPPPTFDGTYLRIYQMTDGLFIQTATVPSEEKSIVLGEDLLIQYTLDNIVAHDLSDPSSPAEVEFPYEDSFVPVRISASPGAIYLSNRNESWTTNASDLDDFTVLEKDGINPFAFYHSPLLYHCDTFDYSQARFSYLTADGDVLSEFDAPVIENTVGYERYGEALWNDHLFIQPVIVDETVPPNVNSDEYPVLNLYELTPDGISSAASATLEVPTSYTFNALGDDELFVLYRENQLFDGEPYVQRNIRITPYSITGEMTFEPLPDFLLIENAEIWQVPTDLTFSDGWLAALVHNSIYLIDASNPDQLLLVSIFENEGEPSNHVFQMEWYKGHLFVRTYLEGLMVFEITDENELSHVGTIPNTNAYEFSVSDERIYFAQRTGSVEVYAFEFDETPVQNWALY